MKDDAYTEIICKELCKYYREGKEELHCNGYVFLRDNFTPHELKTMLDLSKPQKDMKYEIPDEDEELINLVCAKCDFFIDECDYTDNRSGPPCGGYLIIKRGLFDGGK
jgi:hypothetical protein